MTDFINYVEIGNFKSIKPLRLDDCRRINLFIGYQNAGKSNIIEALSLFSVQYLEDGDFLSKLIRVEYINELFYNAKNDNSTFVKTNLEHITLEKDDQNLIIYHNKNKIEVFYHFFLIYI
ncbi:MAG: hypothetical protein LBS50_03280 [Prevotellaceae bacterium]|jgi:AAA15 family ATPase/GTPase|nr:hypothetical protein [Prevotellaceae bacterium]